MRERDEANAALPDYDPEAVDKRSRGKDAGPPDFPGKPSTGVEDRRGRRAHDGVPSFAEIFGSDADRIRRG